MRHNITSKQVVYWFREFLKNKSPAMYEGPKNCYDKYQTFFSGFPNLSYSDRKRGRRYRRIKQLSSRVSTE
jgi:hypothetical protein